jgi:glycosyltransferase involved in cell wall biosynthesis
VVEKLIIFIGSLRGGGAERVCVTLSNELASKGAEIDLVVLNLDRAIWHTELSDKVNLVNLKVAHTRGAFFAYKKYLKKVDPKIILSFNSQISVVLIVLRLMFRLKFTLFSRNINYLSISRNASRNFWNAYVVKISTKLLYPMSDCIIAQCEAMKTDLVETLRIKESKIVVINNPVNRKFESLSGSQRSAILSGQDYLLCIGRLDRQKSFHYAITAFSRIAQKHQALRLKIVGKGALESKLREQVIALGVADRVDFEGFQGDITPYYLSAKATVLTSLYEGFPNVLVESLAMGIPIVSFDCSSGPSEIVQNGVNGYLVEYKNVDHLEQCLSRVVNHKFCQKRIRKTSAKFSTNKIIEKYINVLSSQI